MQSCYSIRIFFCSRIILRHWDDTIFRAGRKATFHSFDSELRWRVKYCLVRQRQVLPRAAKHDEHVKMPLSTSVHCGQRKARGTSGHLWPMISVDASWHHPDNYITNPDILKRWNILKDIELHGTKLQKMSTLRLLRLKMPGWNISWRSVIALQIFVADGWE